MSDTPSKVVTAKHARFAAKVFNLGTIAALIAPFPLFIFWFGASMFVYAMYRFHPNPKVGEYTQRAAYYFYGLAGALIPVLTFASKDFFVSYWWLLWGACFITVFPLALRDIIKANRDEWQDVEIPAAGKE